LYLDIQIDFNQEFKEDKQNSKVTIETHQENGDHKESTEAKTNEKDENSTDGSIDKQEQARKAFTEKIIL